ncbi:MAG: hypothetical protein ABID35_00485 [Candidatus Margulisiibacteriota bacterium]
MLIPTIIMGVLAVSLLAVGYFRGNGAHIAGIKTSLLLVAEILPMLIFAFIVAGMVQAMLPRELIANFIGTDSGAGRLDRPDFFSGVKII